MPTVIKCELDDLSEIQNIYDEFKEFPCNFIYGYNIEFLKLVVICFDSLHLYHYLILSSNNEILTIYNRQNLLSLTPGFCIFPSSRGKIQDLYFREITQGYDTNLDLYCVLYENKKNFVLTKVLSFNQYLLSRNSYVIEIDNKEILVFLCIFTEIEETIVKFYEYYKVIRVIKFKNVVFNDLTSFTINES